MNKNIEIAISADKDLRSMSAETARSIEMVLRQHNMNVRICVLNTYSDIEQLAQRSPDLVFIGMKRLPLGDDYINVSGYLADQGIRTTGSDADAIELERDKTKAKDVVASAGLNTSEYIMANTNQDYEKDSFSMKFPVFIKPSNRGAGLGINENSVIRNLDELNAGIKSLVEDNLNDIVIERYLSGREFSVAVLQKSGNDQCHILPLEIIPPENNKGDRVLGGSIKHADTEKIIVVEPGPLKDTLVDFVGKIFGALNARDYGRIDIRLNDEGIPYFLEANLMPGLSNHGYFYRSLQLNAQISYEEMILFIVQLALERKI